MEPGRADIVLAGASVLLTAARWVESDNAVVNDRGTRYGLFHYTYGGVTAR